MRGVLEIPRWVGGPLTALWQRINDRAQMAPGVWQGFELAGGAYVFVRLGHTGSRTLRIARRERPQTDRGSELWANEVATFIKSFGVAGWEREDEPDAVGVAVRFREPVCACGRALDPNAVAFGDGKTCSACASRAQKPKKVGCVDCGAPVTPEPCYDVQRCTGCAGAAGRAEVAANRARGAELVHTSTTTETR